MRFPPLLVILLWLAIAGRAIGREPVAVKIEHAVSPDGALLLVGTADDWDKCRVKVRVASTGKVAGRFSVADYYAENQRDSISAVWKEDSTAFALNIESGRSITRCGFLVRERKTWSEVYLPGKAIEKLRKAGNKEGGKSQEYLYATEWQPGNKVKISYQGNLGEVTEAIFRLVLGTKPHFELIKFIVPEPEKVVVDEVPCTYRVFAGGLEEGSADGPVAEAHFRWPSGVAVDAAGNVFVADRGNHTIRRISAGGVVETLAGSPGEFGAIDGVGKDARFWYPQCLALDDAGNVYAADTSGNRVRKVTPAGVVTTVLADLKNPTGVAVDLVGNVYVADSNSRVIRKIDRDGSASIVAGKLGETGWQDGRGEKARFQFPSGLAVSADGILYVNDHCAIRKIDAQGVVSTIAGSLTEQGRTDGKGSDARFWHLTGLALDGAGNLYAADAELKNIRRVSPAGVVQTLRGPKHANLPLENPIALVVDRRGDLYVADRDANQILLIELAQPSSTRAK